MLVYILRRLAGSIPVLFLGLTLTFLAIHIAPGDPLQRFLDPGMDPALKQQVAERFGLHEPLPVQYGTWLMRVVTSFDFGISFNSGRPAAAIILEALPPTILVTGLALLGGLLLGIMGGLVCAVYRNTALDRWITAVMLGFYSMPSFLLGVLLLAFFAVKMHWLPASQLTAVFHDQLNFWGRMQDYAVHLILPVTTLAMVSAANFGRYLRTSLIEALQSNYILAARSRGLPERKLIFKYGLRNALIPLISMIGLTIPILFSGAVMIEVIFSLPGLGRITVEAVLARDYPVILAACTLAFTSVIIGNLLADIGYAMADPRVELEQ